MKLKTLLPFLLAFSLIITPIFAQRIAKCIPSLNGTFDPNNSNILYATVPEYGEVRLYMSERTFFAVNSLQKGTWTCLDNKVIFNLGAAPLPPINNNGGNQDPVDNGGNQDPIKTPTNNNPAPASGATDFNLQVRINNPLKVDTIEGAIQLFMNAILRIAIPFIIIFFIWSGLSFILARGNPEKIKTAKKMFWYTIIGTLLILGAWTITNAIIGTVNSITG